MSCTSCQSNDSSPKGCKNNGNCGTQGCNKLNTYNWLSDFHFYESNSGYNLIEVRFKNNRKSFYVNANNAQISIGDIVVTEAEKGFDIGTVSLVGAIVSFQIKKKKIAEENITLKLIRKATASDIKLLHDARDKETKNKKEVKRVIEELRLDMKLSDIEYQGDNTKAYFYYTAEERVDFRELIKKIAYTLKVKVEMKQISARQESAMLGGIGVCGRELCCSTWLNEYTNISISAAKYQQLSINQEKLVGLCGRLKCCLNYELDTYKEITKKFPKYSLKLETKKGKGVCQKIDIFKNILWYAYENENNTWYNISLEKVDTIIAINKKGKKINCLEDYILEENEEKNTYL